MAKLLEGKVAIVTGAGRGIGKAEAVYLAQQGAKVVVNDFGGGFDGEGKASGPAQEVVEEIQAFGGEAIPNFADVSSFSETKEMVDTAISTFGQLNILVNNAGILRDRMIFSMTEEEWDRVVGIHLKGTFNCIRHACSYWRAEHKAGNVLHGAIVNTASDAGLLGNPGQSNYGAAKAGIAALTMIAALEMGRYGVRCNCLAPCARTRLTTDATPAFAQMMEKRWGDFDVFAPENMAPVVAYLASDMADGINGEVVRVLADRVWLLRGWHTTGTVANDKQRWTPEQLDPVLKKLVQDAPPREDLTTPFKDAGAI